MVACCRARALGVAVHAQDLLKEVAIIFITFRIVWSQVNQVKQQGGNITPPIKRKLDSRFTEHGPTHQHKTQVPPQSVSPIRKLPLASYPYPSEGRENENHNQKTHQTDHIDYSLI